MADAQRHDGTIIQPEGDTPPPPAISRGPLVLQSCGGHEASESEAEDEVRVVEEPLLDDARPATDEDDTHPRKHVEGSSPVEEKAEGTAKTNLSPLDPPPDNPSENSEKQTILSETPVDDDGEKELSESTAGTSQDEAPVPAEAIDVANTQEDAAISTKGEEEAIIKSNETHLEEEVASSTTEEGSTVQDEAIALETHLEGKVPSNTTEEGSTVQGEAIAPETRIAPDAINLGEKVAGEEKEPNNNQIFEDNDPESTKEPKIAIDSPDEEKFQDKMSLAKEEGAVVPQATIPDRPTVSIVANTKTPEPPARRLHLDYQQVDSLVSDIPSLLSYLKDHKGETLDDLDLNHLPTWFQQDDRVAFWTPSQEKEGAYDTLTYAQLQQEIAKCPGFINSLSTRVAIAMPSEEMAHTATAVLATMSHANATAVPLGPKVTWDAIQQLGCKVLTMSSTLLKDGCCFEKEGNSIWLALDKASESERTYAQENLQEIRLVQPDICGQLQWTIYQKAKGEQLCWLQVDDQTSYNDQPSPTPPSDPSTPVLLLRTSGTTAQPKVVPITRTHLWYAAKTIATTLQLSPHDCCVNAMPLFHIGGIACNLLGVLVSGGSVVLQGPFHDPMGFLNHITCNGSTSGLVSSGRPVATWYYASPSMHKAVALMAQAQPPAALRNNLRFARSASAHMPHELAMQLSQLLKCGVIPTYGMSEAMPICSSVPLTYDSDEATMAVDTVGYPTGSNVKIVDPETFGVLPYGEIGEICVQGAGVIPRYENLDTGFTPDGWLMTGDLGTIDREGCLFIKGRSKEMIKRGGEQVWPNQVDSVIQTVQGVAVTVTFGVPNPLFGEEVATAVVPVSSATDHDALRQRILQVCKEQLEPNSIPQQIVVLASKDELLRGRTGKYLRSKMAAHLQLKAVDTGALRMLEGVTQQQLSGPSCIDEESCKGKINDIMSSPTSGSDDNGEIQQRVIPSEALNGVRFLVSCFVIHSHVGLFPNLTWVKLQNYTPNMMIFFSLGAFQTTCSVARPVNNQWATWVGTKIGSLHALFVISQFITLPSYVLWSCLDENGDFVCEALDYVDIFVRWFIGTTTGLMHGMDINYYNWFLSTFYIFLIFFPFVDNFLRRQAKVPTLACIMAVTLIITVLLYVGAGTILPTEFFMDYMWMAQFSMATWCWYLVACMCAAYFFKSVVTKHAKQQKEIGRTDATVEEGGSSGEFDNMVNDPDSVNVESIKALTQFWGYVCDACSLLLLAAWITTATYNDTLCLKPETIEAMRGVAEMESAEECHRFGIDGQYRVEDITYDEYVEHVHPDLDYLGRYDQVFSLALGYWKMSAPLILLWVTSMGFGNGMTSRLFGHWIMTSLAPLGYPIYLLQYAVQRYYWLATRGLEAQHWWIEAGLYPFPVEWYETFIVLGLTMLLGAAVNRWLVPLLMPKTISWGVYVCSWISQRSACCLSVCGCGHADRDSDTQGDDDSNSTCSTTSTFDQIKVMVVGLTGVNVTESMELRTLGLSSLGATALLGMLRASVPAAKRLTLRQLQSCTTVGDLAKLLDDRAGNAR